MYLKVNNISRSFGKNKFSLSDISFEVPPGEIFALLGESGSGKTTLLRIIAGFEAADTGEIVLDNKVLVNKKQFLPPEKRETGLVFQDHALFPHLTVEKNICYGIKKGTDSNKKLREMLELTGMTGMEKRYPHELSGGQQQRVAIARSLAADPKLLLLDEPFSNLDDSIKTQVRTEIRSILKQHGTASVFVTHDTQDCFAVADHVLILQHGTALHQGTPEKIYREPASAYIARLFGPVNEFTKEELFELNFFDNNPLIRPYRLEVNKESGVETTIKSCYFNGNNYSIICRYNNKDIIVYNNIPLAAGETSRLRKKE